MIDRDRILELSAQGVSAAAIARELGCAEWSVRRLRRSPRPGPSRRKFTDDEIAAIESMLADGCSYTEVGRTFGRSPSRISHRWPGHGWGAVEAGEFRRYTQRLEERIAATWPRHLAAS